MKKISLKLIFKASLLSLLLSASSCQKMFDVKPEGQVDAQNHYNDIYDANAAVIGIYGQLLGIADRFVVLNELRADLMSPTANADQWLRELNTHQVSADNPWADPKPFYKIIMNCNDAMANFDKMLAEDKITETDYQQRYSDIGAIRSWLYLQLGIHFGSVPYITDPLAELKDLKDESKYPKITFDQLIDNLVAFMAAPERFMDAYPVATALTGATNTSLNTNISGYANNSDRFFINKRILLGDLYLWQGDYTNASKQYKDMSELEYNTTDAANVQRYHRFKPNNGNFNVSYTNGNERTPSYSETAGWQAMFMGDNRISTHVTNLANEWMWTIPFDRNYLPENPFVKLFSNQGGDYKLTASKAALDKWDSQVQNNGFPYDRRGQLTVRTIQGQPVIAKQLYYYLDINTLVPVNVLKRDGRWLIYRAGYLAQRFAEAANADGEVKVAYSLVNLGVRSVFGEVPRPADRTNSEQTFRPAPYDLKAREGGPQGYRDPWYTQIGVRSRANLRPLDATLWQSNNMIGMENAILEENALELAYEGHRWGDLLRVALRRNNPDIISEKVREKLSKDGHPQANTIADNLKDPAKWYLPFKL